MTDRTTRHITLYLREETMGLAGRRTRAVRQRVEALADTDAVDTVEVIEWPRKLAVEGPGPTDQTANDAFNAFCEWARTQDVTLYPAFGTRACYDWETGCRYTALVLPVMALAIYEDTELTAVYPHTDGTAYKTVFDGIETLATGKRTEPRADTPPAIPAD